jgi:preprotein translocase subunit Sec63
MKTRLAKLMLLAFLSPGSAFTQQSQQPAIDVQQSALQEDVGAQSVQANDQVNQLDNQSFSSSKKHKKAKKEKKKKDKKQDQDSISPPDN